MIKTYGLTHIALAVSDLKRTLQFYKEIFGAVPMYQEETWAQVQTPGSHDIIVFEERPLIAGKKSGGIQHFGFRLIDTVSIAEIKEKCSSCTQRFLIQVNSFLENLISFFLIRMVMKLKYGMKSPRDIHFCNVDKLVNNR